MIFEWGLAFGTAQYTEEVTYRIDRIPEILPMPARLLEALACEAALAQWHRRGLCVNGERVRFTCEFQSKSRQCS